MRKAIFIMPIICQLIIFLISFHGCSTLGQSEGIATKKAKQTAGAEKMRLAIIDFAAKGISRSDAEMMNDLLRNKMINTGEFIVLERSLMKEIMKEQSLQMTGITDTQYAVRVGRLLSARKMLVGTITQWRRKILITGRIIDVEKGIADFAHDETIDDIEDLDKGISLFTLNLTNRIKGQHVVSMKKEVKGVDRNYAWIDLGAKNNGHLLALAPNDGAAITEQDVKAGVDCRKLPYPYDGPGHNHMCFDIDDSFMWGGNNEVWIVMEYFDSGTAINCQYDSNGRGPVDGAFRGSADGAFPKLRLRNSGKWKFHVWHIKDGRFQNRGNGFDFRFSTHGGGSMWVNRVWVLRYKPQEPFRSDAL